MPVVISILRGVNLARHNRVKMEALRALYEKLGLENPQTYVQSGNVVFRTKERNLTALAQRIEKAVEQKFGFRTAVIVRTASELRSVIARNPFAARPGIEPNRFLVTFLATAPSAEDCNQVRQLKGVPEEVHIDGHEVFMYFPNGLARPKLSWVTVEKMLKTSGTARNWNSVTKLLEMAEKLENA